MVGRQGAPLNQTNSLLSKQPEDALFLVVSTILYLSSKLSSSSPVPLHTLQDALRHGWKPVPPHSGHIIGSKSVMIRVLYG